jgi:Tol biopolymer transport system component
LLKGDVNSKWWEGSITISHDGRKIYFASERPGGLGGRDIYEARLSNDEKWVDVKNLGSNVNTSMDDDAPFLHPSGKYLVFSSAGHNSMGGFDIFVSELKADSTWDKPKNIGYPINSTTDDKFYTVTADGLNGYYSSDKKGGLGKQDLYKVTPGIDKNVVLAQVIGDVYLDDFPTFCEIEVIDDKIQFQFPEW